MSVSTGYRSTRVFDHLKAANEVYTDSIEKMWGFLLNSFRSKNMALFAFLEDAGHPLLTASIPTVKDGEKEDIRS